MLGHLGAGVPIGSHVLGDPARLGAQLAGGVWQTGWGASQVSPGWWRVGQAGGELDRQGMTVWVTGRQQGGVGEQGWLAGTGHSGMGDPVAPFTLGGGSYVRTSTYHIPLGSGMTQIF